MKKVVILFTLAVVIIAGCRKQSAELIPPGEYKGTFTRSKPHTNTISSNVTMDIDGNTYMGNSDITHYPEICTGTYSLNSGKLTANNKCVFVASFDWTFVFTGEYFYKVNGKELRIWKNYSDDSTDIYILNRVK